MQKLIQGIRMFEQETFPMNSRLFKELAKEQHPHTLFIACSDSRVVPTVITGSAPGDLFVVRNPGNIVPPSGSPPNGEAAAIEYAIGMLNVEDAVVCGHTGCGAMQGLADEQLAARLPHVCEWTRYASTAKARAERRCDPWDPGFLRSLIEENVLLQLQHLRSHSVVASREAAGGLRLHGWLYEIEHGRILIHDPGTGEFKRSSARRARISGVSTTEGY